MTQKKNTPNTNGQPNKHDDAFWPAIWQELANTNDRSAAIVGEAVLDEILSRLLSSYFIENQDEVKPLFEYRGSLSNFSVKTSIAYCLGLITKGQLKQLKAIKNIRNHFAHSLEAASFEDQGIIEEIAKIELYKGLRASDIDRPRKQFDTAVAAIAQYLVNETARTVHCQEKKDKSLTELLQDLGKN